MRVFTVYYSSLSCSVSEGNMSFRRAFVTVVLRFQSTAGLLISPGQRKTVGPSRIVNNNKACLGKCTSFKKMFFFSF